MISVWLVVTSRLQFEDNISRKLEGLCALQSILQYATISFHILQFEENISGKLQGLPPAHFTPSANRPPAFYHALSLHNILFATHYLCTIFFLPRIIFAQYSFYHALSLHNILPMIHKIHNLSTVFFT